MKSEPCSGRRGYVHIYMGNGKGKTTAALGLALRAIGNGLKVIMYQFLKNRECGEHRIKLNNFKIVRVNEFRVHEILKEIESYDIVIFDEILYAINKGVIRLEDVIKFINEKPKNVEIILTGRNAPKELIELADLVTEMRKIKHYFDKGIKARTGIEC